MRSGQWKKLSADHNDLSHYYPEVFSMFRDWILLGGFLGMTFWSATRGSIVCPSPARGRSHNKRSKLILFLQVAVPHSGNSCGETPCKRQFLWAPLLGSWCGSGEESPHPAPPSMSNWFDIWPTLTLCLDIISLCLLWRHTADTWSNARVVTLCLSWYNISVLHRAKKSVRRSSSIDGPNLRSWQEHKLV